MYQVRVYSSVLSARANELEPADPILGLDDDSNVLHIDDNSDMWKGTLTLVWQMLFDVREKTVVDQATVRCC